MTTSREIPCAFERAIERVGLVVRAYSVEWERRGVSVRQSGKKREAEGRRRLLFDEEWEWKGWRVGQRRLGRIAAAC